MWPSQLTVFLTLFPVQFRWLHQWAQLCTRARSSIGFDLSTSLSLPFSSPSGRSSFRGFQKQDAGPTPNTGQFLSIKLTILLFFIWSETRSLASCLFSLFHLICRMVLSLSDVSSKGFGRSSWETFRDHLKSSRLCYCSVWATFRCVSMFITRNFSWGYWVVPFPLGEVRYRQNFLKRKHIFLYRACCYVHTCWSFPSNLHWHTRNTCNLSTSSVPQFISWLETGVAKAKLTFSSEWNSVEFFWIALKTSEVFIYADKMLLILKAVANANTYLLDD